MVLVDTSVWVTPLRTADHNPQSLLHTEEVFGASCAVGGTKLRQLDQPRGDSTSAA